jgi:hypothetical protein
MSTWWPTYQIRVCGFCPESQNHSTPNRRPQLPQAIFTRSIKPSDRGRSGAPHGNAISRGKPSEHRASPAPFAPTVPWATHRTNACFMLRRCANQAVRTYCKATSTCARRKDRFQKNGSNEPVAHEWCEEATIDCCDVDQLD